MHAVSTWRRGIDGPSAAVELATPTGARFLLVGATPVLAAGGALLGVTVALRDVTKARRIDGFRGDLVAAAAHELRTPLTSLHMAVHLCLEQAAGPLTERQTDLLAAARTDCLRIQSVIDELLEMARLESGAVRLNRARFPVEDLVLDAISRHDAEARAAGTELVLVPSDRLCEVEADAERIRHVFGNLFDNAIKYAGDRGPIRVGWERADHEVRILVDDEGPGVHPSEREKIFAKFYRAPGVQRSGSGLGLSIAHDIVRAHGGQLGVIDAPRGGARFWFTLPVAGLAQP